MLAFALWYREGLEFGPGLCAGDQPDASALDATGHPSLWLMVGEPAAERLRTFSRRATQLALLLYAPGWRRWWTLHGAEVETIGNLSVLALDGGLAARMGGALRRRMHLAVTVSGGQLYVDLDGWREDAELMVLCGDRLA